MHSTNNLLISIPVASELILPAIGTLKMPFLARQINCRETALPCPLYHSGAVGIDMNPDESMVGDRTDKKPHTDRRSTAM